MNGLMCRMVGGGRRNNPGPSAYNIRSTIGDAPKYTIKGRHRSVERPNNAPYRVLPTTVGESPRISLKSRHKEAEGYVTPGPNYVPPRLGTNATKTSFHSRPATAKDPRLDNPGPGAYNYTPRFANDANKYTFHQRTALSARDFSPGPAAYTPDYKKAKKSSPQATMHVRPKDRAIAVTPGPSDYEVSRDLGGQQSTMHIRPRDNTVNNTPGPGQYTPTDGNKPKDPSFTMKGRHEIAQKPNTAPYRDLPSTVGEGPKISLSSRHKDQNPYVTPGPNYIPPTIGGDAPKPTLSGRTAEAADPRRENPGPGAYDVKPQFGNEAQKSTFHQRTGTEVPDLSPGPAAYSPQVPKNGPVATMHVRPKDRDIPVTPGPSDYEVSRDLGGQQSTMHIRPRDNTVNNTPGPGQYTPTDGNKPKDPSFTMKGRHEIPERPNTAPYRDLPSTVGEGPKISLSSRHKDQNPYVTPGPNYIPPTIGDDAPKPALSGRTAEAADPRRENPGPGAYDVKPQFGNEAQKSTFHQRTGTEVPDLSPGPAAYSPQLPSNAKASTMHVRPKDRDIPVTPGPSDYEVSRDLGGQQSTMHIRPRDNTVNNTPGPGQYTPTDGNKPKDPSFTMKGRHEIAEKPNTAPYRDLPSTVGEGPKISLSSRHKDQNPYVTPGPNYIPPTIGDDAPKPTLSGRTAEAADPRRENPGPGAYDVKPQFGNEAQKSTFHQRTGTEVPDISPGPAAYSPQLPTSGPVATMHVRPKDRDIPVTPGPSDYEVSRDLGGQQSTMHIRPQDNTVNNTPGPGQYTPTDGNRPSNPRFTMKGRHEIAEKPNTAPYRELPTTVGEGPKISLSSRHKDQNPYVTPGPNYIPPTIGDDAPKPALSGRTAEAADPRRENPGPGAYDVKPQFGNEAQKSTFHQRTGTEVPDLSPGPAAYSPQLPTSGPVATMHVRPKDRDIPVTPGPSDYEVSRDLGGQQSTMHIRPRDNTVNNTPGPGQYTPTDGNKPKDPSFTMKGRHEIPERPNTAPYRDLPSTVGEGPKISLSSRHKDQNPYVTPGPNYIPPTIGDDAPKPTLSGRTAEAADPRRENPGPGAYDVKPQFGNEAQKSTFHQRTGTEVPDLSPGPAAYSPQLPTSGPVATMHVRPKDRDIPVTPGPSDYEVSRDLGGQQSTMHIRPRDNTVNNTPGPGQYTPTDGNKPKDPSFTMKGRHEIAEKPNTAPYRDLPSTVGEGPKISLSSRHKDQNPYVTPGPNYIPPTIGDDAPKPALSGRTAEAADPRRENPGPGAYDVKPQFGNEAQKSTFHQRTGTEVPDLSPGPAAYSPQLPSNAKASTMHVRPKDRDIPVTPGPSDYEVSRDLGGQQSTMHIRPRDNTVNNTPGPGQYTPTDGNKPKDPSFTMKGRHEIAEKPNTAPYRDLPSTVGEGPKISLSSRPKDQNPYVTPGPNYIPPTIGDDAPKPTLSGRTAEAADPRRDNPGPGAYDVKPQFGNEAQKSTFHQRTGTEVPDLSPGPAAYSPQLPSNGQASTMHVRPKDKTPEETPGYYKLPSTLSGPKYTIGNREDLDLEPV